MENMKIIESSALWEGKAGEENFGDGGRIFPVPAQFDLRTVRSPKDPHLGSPNLSGKYCPRIDLDLAQ